MAIRAYAIKSPSRSIMSLFQTFCRLAAVMATMGAALVATPPASPSLDVPLRIRL